MGTYSKAVNQLSPCLHLPNEKHIIQDISELLGKLRSYTQLVS